MNYPYYGYGNYNNQLMQNYQPLQPQQPVQPQQTMQMQDERIWVSGKNSADAYLVAPNSFVRLWDSTASVFYEKRADQSGRPYMEAFEYKKVDNANIQPQTTGYNDRFDSIEKRLKALEGVIENVSKSNTNDTAIPTV